MPRVTIVTATRGRPEELERALRSAVEQDFADFEHLVVDDASPDAPAQEVADRVGDGRVRVIRLQVSRGPAGARNVALAEARGAYVAILDDDDLMAPGRLAKSVAFLDAHADCVLVAGAFRAIDAAGETLAVVRPPTEPDRIAELLPLNNPVCHSSATVRRDVLQQLGGYREALRYSHDYDMVLRTAERGRIAILPDLLADYRFHLDNISAARSLLQGAYADVARRCASRRRSGEAEELESQVAAIDVSGEEASRRRALGRVHYQIGEWMFLDDRIREARPHFFKALLAEPLRPLCLGLNIAAWTPAWLRRVLAPVVRPLVARRYPRWA